MRAEALGPVGLRDNPFLQSHKRLALKLSFESPFLASNKGTSRGQRHGCVYKPHNSRYFKKPCLIGKVSHYYLDSSDGDKAYIRVHFAGAAKKV